MPGLALVRLAIASWSSEEVVELGLWASSQSPLLLPQRCSQLLYLLTLIWSILGPYIISLIQLVIVYFYLHTACLSKIKAWVSLRTETPRLSASWPTILDASLWNFSQGQALETQNVGADLQHGGTAPIWDERLEGRDSSTPEASNSLKFLYLWIDN